jgi:hypothetical protein
MSAYGIDILSGDYDDDEGVSGREILAAIDVLGRASRKERKGARLSSRLERRGDKGKDVEGGLLSRRVARILGQPNLDETVVENTPDVIRRYSMPLGRKTIPFGATDTLEKNAQRVIRIERLVLASKDLADFDVTAIFIGVEQQNASVANTPAEAYSFNAIATSFRGNTLNPGMSASVSCLNNGLVDASIAGVFYGEAMQQ